MLAIRFALLAVVLASCVACAPASPAPVPVVTTVVVEQPAPLDTTAAATMPTAPVASIDPVRRPDAPLEQPLDVETASEDPSELDICTIDPTLCLPIGPALAASCHCTKLKGRDAQKCLIDCAARERTKVNQELDKLGP